jgi:hypothetical protein
MLAKASRERKNVLACSRRLRKREKNSPACSRRLRKREKTLWHAREGFAKEKKSLWHAREGFAREKKYSGTLAKASQERKNALARSRRLREKEQQNIKNKK